jgi:hypothetical protein
MTTPESPSTTDEALRAQLQAALAPGKTSAFFTVFYAALAVALYFGIKRLLAHQVVTRDPTALVLRVFIECAAAFLTAYAAHALYRWQEYPKILKTFQLLEPQVPTSRREWFYAQVSLLLGKPDDTMFSQGLNSTWEPDALSRFVLLAGVGFLYAVCTQTAVQAWSFSAWQSLSDTSLAVVFVLVAAAL